MKMISVFAILNLAIALFVGGVSFAKTPEEARKIAKKVAEFAGKNGYVSSTSAYREDGYQGTKNADKYKTEQWYELTYATFAALNVSCHSCLSKDISPVDHAKCRAEFMKLFQAVHGKRSAVKEIPYILTPAEGSTERMLGDDKSIRILVKPVKCDKATSKAQATSNVQSPPKDEPAQSEAPKGEAANAEPAKADETVKMGYTFSISDVTSVL